MLSRRSWHSDFVAGIAELLRPKLYVEVGIGSCETINAVALFAQRSIGIDVDAGTGKDLRSTVEFLNLPSLRAARELALRREEIDLVFVDADHRAEAVVADFEAFAPLVRDQGLILLHDTYPGSEKETDPGLSGDAWRAIAGLAAVFGDSFEFATIPVPPGITIVRKRLMQIPWLNA